ncbi:MAG: hypothetical protein V7603_1954 [Micromonosporaceae bacterium]
MSAMSDDGTRGVVLVGLGPHSRRIYYPALAAHAARERLRLALLVELEDQKDTVERFLAGQPLQPEQIVYVPTSYRDGATLSDAFVAAGELARRRGLWGAVVATEPKSHLVYARWALRNGLHVLLDKPITGTNLFNAEPREALRLVDDFVELSGLASRSGRKVLVQTQRRAHLGYELVHAYLVEFLGAFEVPISYVDLYHADGMWNMPSEYVTRENHPYKYGYGKLMHSGYHFVDLFASLVSLNQQLSIAPDRVEMTVRHVRPTDHMAQVHDGVHRWFFGADRDRFPADPSELRGYGEVDAFLLMQLLRGDEVMTTGALSLLQTSFSRRAWPRLPADTYKGNGRVRHERVTIQVGPLLSIQVHSYQSYEAKDWIANTAGAGSYEHFDIYFFRNSALVGGPAFDSVTLGDASRHRRHVEQGYLGHNEAARTEVFRDFLNEDAGRAGLASHELPVKLTAATYYSMLRLNREGRPGSQVSLVPGDPAWFLPGAA